LSTGLDDLVAKELSAESNILTHKSVLILEVTISAAITKKVLVVEDLNFVDITAVVESQLVWGTLIVVSIGHVEHSFSVKKHFCVYLINKLPNNYPKTYPSTYTNSK
jgi:hypothetical protein